MQHRKYQDDGEFEEIVYKRDTPLIWRSLQEFNLTETETCRNSEQGKLLLVDERGFICDRDDVLATGCCNIKADNTHLYNCKSCNENQCCEIFENCVSCCLNPDNVSFKDKKKFV